MVNRYGRIDVLDCYFYNHQTKRPTIPPNLPLRHPVPNFARTADMDLLKRSHRRLSWWLDRLRLLRYAFHPITVHELAHELSYLAPRRLLHFRWYHSYWRCLHRRLYQGYHGTQ